MKYPQLWRSSGFCLILLFTAMATPTAPALSHTVRSGETFTAIARQHKISLAELQKSNPGVKPGLILKGQVLKLPSTAKKESSTSTAATKKTKSAAEKPSSRKQKNADRETTLASRTPAASSSRRQSAIKTYEVKSGDTLGVLARHHGTSAADLVELNGLDSSNLQIGQKLILPVKDAPAVAKPAPARSKPTAPTPRVQSPADRENTVDLTPPGRRHQESPPARQLEQEEPTPAPQGAAWHVVRKGDTLSSIAKEHGIPLSTLLKANQNVDPRRLALNQKISVPGTLAVSSSSRTSTGEHSLPPAQETSYLPAPGSSDTTSDFASESGLPENPPEPARIAYRVTPRDSMDSIARAFGTTPKDLRQLNQLGTFDRLTAGNYLIVPAPAPPSLTASAN